MRRRHHLRKDNVLLGFRLRGERLAARGEEEGRTLE